MKIFSGKTILIIAFALLSLSLVIFILNNKPFMKKGKETFVDSKNYQARLTVIDVFDEYMCRNATPKEINRYSEFKTKENIMKEVEKDFPDSFVKKGCKGDKSKSKSKEISDENISKKFSNDVQTLKHKLNPKEKMSHKVKNKAKKKVEKFEDVLSDAEDEFYMKKGYVHTHDNDMEVPEIKKEKQDKNIGHTSKSFHVVSQNKNKNFDDEEEDYDEDVVTDEIEQYVNKKDEDEDEDVDVDEEDINSDDEEDDVTDEDSDEDENEEDEDNSIKGVNTDEDAIIKVNRKDMMEINRHLNQAVGTLQRVITKSVNSL